MPTEEYKSILAKLITDARALRKVQLPPASAGPHEFYATLLIARANLDRMEELLSRAMQTHAWARTQERSKADTANDAWDHASEQDAGWKGRSGNDYEGAKERSARINLKVLPATKVAREAAADADLAKYTVDQLRLLYQGLDGVRRDLHRVLSYFPLESNLER